MLLGTPDSVLGLSLHRIPSCREERLPPGEQELSCQRPGA